jgi:hypothetical protein
MSSDREQGDSGQEQGGKVVPLPGDREQGEKVVQLPASPRAHEPQSAEEIARDRAVFRLRVQGLSVEACAEQLNCSIDDVVYSLSRMTCMPVEQLRKNLMR